VRGGMKVREAIKPSLWLPVASSVHLLPLDKQLKEHHCSFTIHRYTDQTGRSRAFTSSRGLRTWVAHRVCSVFRAWSSPCLPSSGSDSVHRPQLKPPCGIYSFTTTTMPRKGCVLRILLGMATQV
jgi:hypothetical protein